MTEHRSVSDAIIILLSSVSEHFDHRVHYLVFRCFQFRNTKLLVRAFTTYVTVRLLLEVNSQVWSPHLLKDIRRLEAVQPYNVDLLHSCWGCTHLLILSASNYLVWRDSKREESEPTYYLCTNSCSALQPSKQTTFYIV